MRPTRIISRLTPVFGFCAALCGLPSAARADEAPRFFIRGGPAYATFGASAHVSVNGVEVPGETPACAPTPAPRWKPARG